MNIHSNHHFRYTVSLAVILLLSIFLVTQLAYDKQLQVLVVILTSIFYVAWGIIHHIIHHDLSIKIVVEYTIIGSLGMSIILFFLKGGTF